MSVSRKLVLLREKRLLPLLLFFKIIFVFFSKGFLRLSNLLVYFSTFTRMSCIGVVFLRLIYSKKSHPKIIIVRVYPFLMIIESDFYILKVYKKGERPKSRH